MAFTIAAYDKAISVEAYVLRVLMRDLAGHDRKPSAVLVYLHLWAETEGRGGGSVALSYQQIADAVGLSRSAVQAAVGHLRRRGLIAVRQASRTAVPDYEVRRPWER